MYRNIYYNNRKGTITLFTWNDMGDRTQNEYPFKPYLYVESQNSKDGVSIYNTPLRKIEFKNQYERNKFVQESGIKRLFHNIKVEQQFLLEQFGSISTSKEFSQNPLRVFYIDIEVYSPDKFPESSEAKHPINVLTIYDTITNIYYTWGLKENYKPSKENVIYEKCETETQLLRKVLTFWADNCPDILSGWNCAMFDIPYLINRCNNILEENEVLQLSPVAQIYKREGVVQRFGKMEDKWYIKGVSILDYMEIYKTFSYQQLESYSLDFVAGHELGKKKLEHKSANLAQLASEDWKTFVDYNIRDVEILFDLDSKLKFIDVVKMMAYLGLTTFEAALGTIAVVTGAMAVKAEERGLKLSTFNTSKTPQYEGGHVQEPNRGLKESIISYDANSLYPNTIITLNLSPETKLGKIISISESEVEFRLTSGKEYVLPKRKFAEFIKSENIAISKAKCLFSQNTKGLCPDLVDGIYKQRVNVREKLKNIEKSQVYCKEGSKKYIENIKEIEYLDKYQKILKILINRVYGAFANPYSPFCDVDIASSITLTGQACIKEASRIVNEHTKEKYGIDTDSDNICIYIDTDSNYFTIDPILKKLNKSFYDEDDNISQDVYIIEKEFNDILNTGINNWALKSLNSSDPRLVFKREAICDAAIFIQKKRYILHVLDNEGVKCDKMKYVGVEVQRSNIPQKPKKYIKDVVESIIKTRDYKATNKLYFDAFEEFKKMPIEEIAFPQGIHNFQKYTSQSTGLKTAKHTPVHAKASIYYNYLLDHFNITNKYEKITGDAKIKWFYTKKNKFGIETIAFMNQYPKEFGLEVDHDKMFKKIVGAAVERLYETISWRIKDPNSQECVDLFEFFA